MYKMREFIPGKMRLQISNNSSAQIPAETTMCDINGDPGENRYGNMACEGKF
jgi:hypothetical protein